MPVPSEERHHHFLRAKWTEYRLANTRHAAAVLRVNNSPVVNKAFASSQNALVLRSACGRWMQLRIHL